LASYHAISAIGQAVVSLLKSARPAIEFPSFDVKLFQAKDVQSQSEFEGLSLFLYRVVASSSRRQMSAMRTFPTTGRSGATRRWSCSTTR
jgi:hypothetical protein